MVANVFREALSEHLKVLLIFPIIIHFYKIRANDGRIVNFLGSCLGSINIFLKNFQDFLRSVI